MGLKSNSKFFKNIHHPNLINSTLNNRSNVSKPVPKKGKKSLNKVTNPNLKNTILQLYRPGSKFGDGSTQYAIKQEVKYGKIFNKSHINKGIERIKNLENLINKKNAK